MTEKEEKKYSVWLMILIPLAIIFLGYLFSKDPEQDNGYSQKKANSIYSIWLTEAEVEPNKKDQSQWDVDGTAPDLSAMVVWKDQIILNTVTSNDSLIARWDPIAISVGDVYRSIFGIMPNKYVLDPKRALFDKLSHCGRVRTCPSLYRKTHPY